MTESTEERFERIRQQLFPTDPSFCAEVPDLDDIRWLFALADRLSQQVDELAKVLVRR